MQAYENPFTVSEAAADDRATFYRKTYSLVAAAFLAWAFLLGLLFTSGAAWPLAKIMLSAGAGISWLIILALFWLVTTFAQSLAFSNSSRATQYAGLALYIVAEALIFVPIIALVFVHTASNNDTIWSLLVPAGLTTALLFLGLTVTVFTTRTDFSFLKTAVVLGSFIALGAIIVFSIFGISPGSWFAIAMIVLMGAAILWQTWQVKEKCHTDQYVGAAVLLFAGFMTLLWYVIQLYLRRR